MHITGGCTGKSLWAYLGLPSDCLAAHILPGAPESVHTAIQATEALVLYQETGKTPPYKANFQRMYQEVPLDLSRSTQQLPNCPHCACCTRRVHSAICPQKLWCFSGRLIRPKKASHITRECTGRSLWAYLCPSQQLSSCSHLAYQPREKHWNFDGSQVRPCPALHITGGCARRSLWAMNA